MSDSRKILKNMFSLSLAEVATKGIALITASYLSRAILADGFGIIGFSNAITIYFMVLISLGFNTVGIREIAKSHDEIPKFVNAIISMRLIIAIVCFVALGFVIIGLNKPDIVKLTLLVAGLNFISQAFLLDWVYQGIEKMEVQAVRQVITGILTLVGTVLLVHSPSDVLIAMAVVVASAFLNSFWMLAYYVKRYGMIKFTYNKELWLFLLKSSIPIGLTSLIIANYNYLSTILLGLFRNDYETGIYSAAYKVLVVTILPSTVVQNAFFPALSRAKSTEERIRIMKKYTSLMFLIAAILSGLIFTYADHFIVALFGVGFISSIPILKIMMLTSLLMYANVSITAPLMAWDKEKAVMYAIGLSGIISTILNLIFIPVYGFYGAAYITIISELVVFIGVSVVNYRLIHKFFSLDLIKFGFFSSIACTAGYLAMINGVNSIVSLVITLLIYAGINFLFKTVTVSELKGYIAK